MEIELVYIADEDRFSIFRNIEAEDFDITDDMVRQLDVNDDIWFIAAKTKPRHIEVLNLHIHNASFIPNWTGLLTMMVSPAGIDILVKEFTALVLNGEETTFTYLNDGELAMSRK